MTFIANALEQFHRRMRHAQAQGFGLVGQINFLKLFGQANGWNILKTELGQFRASHAQLAPAAVDQDQIGEGGSF